MKNKLIILLIFLVSFGFSQVYTVQDIMNAVYDPSETLTIRYSTQDVFNGIYDDTNNALRVNISGGTMEPDSVTALFLAVTDSAYIDTLEFTEGYGTRLSVSDSAFVDTLENNVLYGGAGTFTGDVDIQDSLSVDGNATVAGTIGSGAITINSGLTTTGAEFTLSSKELTVEDGDVLGRIDFNAGLESSGTDAILAGASIWAESDSTFEADDNSTSLAFGTASSGVPTAMMRISSLGDVGIGIAPATGVQLLLPQENDAATPTLAFGDGNTGFYEKSNNELTVAVGGTRKFEFTSIHMGSSGSGGRITNAAPSATAPHVYAGDDTDTGIGSAAADQLSLIAGGTEMIRLTESTADTMTVNADQTTITGNLTLDANQDFTFAVIADTLCSVRVGVDTLRIHPPR